MPKEDTQFKPGNQEGKKKGRGISIKQHVKWYYQANPEKFNEVIEKLATHPKYIESTWRMLEGAPKQTGELEHKIPESLAEFLINEAETRNQPKDKD